MDTSNEKWIEKNPAGPRTRHANALKISESERYHYVRGDHPQTSYDMQTKKYIKIWKKMGTEG